MKTLLLTLGIIAITALIIAVRAGKKALKAKEPVFVCDRCGEHHCECHLENR